jgi:hypothetical protein
MNSVLRFESDSLNLADRLQRVVEASWTLRRFQTLVELAASVKRLATGV